uniref:Uncharacterized protein n=1 Tax=Solanum lycopersicum TaxID=4081 RepID=A0A3Q7IHB0_SOLLC
MELLSIVMEKVTDCLMHPIARGIGQQSDPKRIHGEIAKGVGLTLEGDDMLSHGDRLCTRESPTEDLLVQ